MQSNEMAEKSIVKFGGEEIPGLVNFAEVTRERRTTEVPGFDKIIDLDSGIEKLPALVLIYKLDRATNALAFFRKYFQDKEVKDLEKIRTDAHGVPFETIAYTGCACHITTDPAYDAATPVYAQISVTLLPSAIEIIE